MGIIEWKGESEDIASAEASHSMELPSDKAVC